MTVEEYRKRHKNCRYCEHNRSDCPEIEMECRAKNKYGPNYLLIGRIRAALCKLYIPGKY